MSSSPFAPPPTETPNVVPPNRAPQPGPVRALLTWIILIVLLLAVYNVFSGQGPRVASTPQHTPVFLWGWLVPLATYGGTIVALILIRSRLPAKYRTGELREIAAANPESPAPAEALAPIDVRYRGSDGNGPVELHVDDHGIHWHAEKRLLIAASELHAPWSTIESVSVGQLYAPMMTWAFIVILAGLFLVSIQPWITAVCIVLGGGLVVIGRSRKRGTFTFATSTHALMFTSAELDAAARDRLMAAARQRKPSAVAPAGKPGRGVLYLLVVDPFAQIARSIQPHSVLRASMIRQGATYADEDTALTGTLQFRMFALWSGVMRGAGPFSVAIGAGLAYGVASAAGMGMAAWVIGLIVIGRGSEFFARFSGMSVVR